MSKAVHLSLWQRGQETSLRQTRGEIHVFFLRKLSDLPRSWPSLFNVRSAVAIVTASKWLCILVPLPLCVTMLPTACVLRLSIPPDPVVCPEHLGGSSPWGKHQEVWVESLY